MAPDVLKMMPQRTISRLSIDDNDRLQDLQHDLASMTMQELIQMGQQAQNRAILGVFTLGACAWEIRRRDADRQRGGRGKRDTDGTGIQAQLQQAADAWGMTLRSLQRYAQFYKAFFVRNMEETDDSAVIRFESVTLEDLLEAARSETPYQTLASIRAAKMSRGQSCQTRPTDVQATQSAPDFDDLEDLDDLLMGSGVSTLAPSANATVETTVHAATEDDDFYNPLEAGFLAQGSSNNTTTRVLPAVAIDASNPVRHDNDLDELDGPTDRDNDEAITLNLNMTAQISDHLDALVADHNDRYPHDPKNRSGYLIHLIESKHRQLEIDRNMEPYDDV